MTESSKNEVDDVTGVKTTGHEWDGIRELDNPMPKWWLYTFYASIVWSLAYWVVMLSSGPISRRRDGPIPKASSAMRSAMS